MESDPYLGDFYSIKRIYIYYKYQEEQTKPKLIAETKNSKT